ncbi:MAG: tetratricopeptide repeat protein [bacterium]
MSSTPSHRNLPPQPRPAALGWCVLAWGGVALATTACGTPLRAGRPGWGVSASPVERATLLDELRSKTLARAHELSELILLAGEQRDDGSARVLRRQQRTLFAHARALLHRAFRQRRRLLEDPQNAGLALLDRVLRNACANLRELAERASRRGDRGRARAYSLARNHLLRRLIREHPTSRLVGRALLELAESYRQQRRCAEALTAYRKVVRTADPALIPPARFGMGRCFMELRKFRRALPVLAALLADPSARALLSEARGALFETWTHVGKPSEAYGFLERIARGKRLVPRNLFLRLARWAAEHERDELAHSLLREARRRWPRDHQRCRWWLAQLDSATRLHDHGAMDLALAEAPTLLRSLRAQLGWHDSALRQCRFRMEQALRQVATTLHALGMTLHSVARLETARRAYELYLRTFQSATDHYLMAYQHADLTWLMISKDLHTSGPTWRALARRFTRLVKTPRPKAMDRAEYRAKRSEAALAAVRCLMKANRLTRQKLLRAHRPESPGRPGARPPWISIPLRWQELLDALELYLEIAPRSHYRSAIMFNAGHIYWKYNQFERALPRLVKVALEHASDQPESARTAAVRVVEMLTLLGRRRELQRLIDRFLEIKDLMWDEAFRHRMLGLKIKSLWATANRHRRQPSFARCGAKFEKLVRQHAGSRFQDTILWNAGACYDRAKMLRPALRMYRALQQRYPHSRHAAPALFRLGRRYEQLTFFRKAAQRYEQFFVQHSRHRQAAEAMFRALQLRAAFGDERQMLTLASSIEERFGATQPRLAARARWQVIRAFQAFTLPRKLAPQLEHYVTKYAAVRPDRTIEALVGLGALRVKQGRRRLVLQGRRLLTRALERWNRFLRGPGARTMTGLAKIRIARLRRHVHRARLLLAGQRRRRRALSRHHHHRPTTRERWKSPALTDRRLAPAGFRWSPDR